jgi:hypothetical protein
VNETTIVANFAAPIVVEVGLVIVSCDSSMRFTPRYGTDVTVIVVTVP